MEYVVDLKFVYQDEITDTVMFWQFDLMGRVRGLEVSYIVSVSVLLLVQIVTRLNITTVCVPLVPVPMWCYSEKRTSEITGLGSLVAELLLKWT